MPDVKRALLYIEDVLRADLVRPQRDQVSEIAVVRACLMELDFLKRENAGLRDGNTAYTETLARAGIPGLMPTATPPGYIPPPEPGYQRALDAQRAYMAVDVAVSIRERQEMVDRNDWVKLRELEERQRGRNRDALLAYKSGLVQGAAGMDTISESPVLDALRDAEKKSAPTPAAFTESDADAITAYLAAYREATDAFKDILGSIKANRILEASQLTNMLEKMKALGGAINPSKGWLVFFRDRGEKPPVSIAFTAAEADALIAKKREATAAKESADPTLMPDLAQMLLTLQRTWEAYSQARASIAKVREDNLTAADLRDRAKNQAAQQQASLRLIEVMRRGLEADEAMVKSEIAFMAAMDQVTARLNTAVQKAKTLRAALEAAAASGPSLEESLAITAEGSQVARARRRLAQMNLEPEPPKTTPAPPETPERRPFRELGPPLTVAKKRVAVFKKMAEPFQYDGETFKPLAFDQGDIEVKR